MPPAGMGHLEPGQRLLQRHAGQQQRRKQHATGQRRAHPRLAECKRLQFKRSKQWLAYVPLRYSGGRFPPEARPGPIDKSLYGKKRRGIPRRFFSLEGRLANPLVLILGHDMPDPSRYRDVLCCARCGAKREVLAVVMCPEPTTAILAHLDLADPQGPPRPTAMLHPFANVEFRLCAVVRPRCVWRWG